MDWSTLYMILHWTPTVYVAKQSNYTIYTKNILFLSDVVIAHRVSTILPGEIVFGICYCRWNSFVIALSLCHLESVQFTEARKHMSRGRIPYL